MLLNHILRKSTGGNKCIKSSQKINHFVYIEDINLVAEKEKELVMMI